MIPLLLVLSRLPAVPSPDTCAPGVLLPAYAHNDYRNQRPLFDALALGYRGVEADLFRVGTELLVGHDRGELRPPHSLARLYLEPLQHRKRSCGYVLADFTSFLLNIELKEPDPAAFRLLVSQLLGYEDLFHAPSSQSRPDVVVTLVGWWPGAEPDASSWPAFLRVHVPLGQDGSPGEPPLASRIGLVSIDYGKMVRWSGRGPVPHAAGEVLATACQLAASYGVPIRVHHAPQHRAIYAWLLSEGVALIGADDLRGTRSLLQDLSGQPPPRVQNQPADRERGGGATCSHEP